MKVDKRHRKAIIAMSSASTAQEMLAAASKAQLVTDDGRILLHRGISSELSGVDLSLVDFQGVSFKNIRFVNCPSSGVTFTDCTFDRCWFAAEGTGRGSLRNAKLVNCAFVDTSFGAARLDLAGIEFIHTRFRDCEFRFGKLAGARFERCYLDYVFLRSANLEGASFAGSVLKKVCFEKSNLSSVDFEGVSFQQGNFWGPLDVPGFPELAEQGLT